MRGRRVFPGEHHYQRDYTRYLRIANVDSVDTENGVCTVTFYDSLTSRTDVILTQGGPNSFEVPTQGSTVVIGTGSNQEAIILSYIPKGWVQRVAPVSEGGQQSLPPVEQGEKYLESVTSDGRRTYLYLSRIGNVEIGTANNQRTGIDDGSRTHFVETENQRSVTTAGLHFAGKIKRLVANALVQIQQLSRYLTEVRTKVYEYFDEAMSVVAPVTPIADITIGTAVNDLGVITNRLGALAATPEQQVCVQIKLARSLPTGPNIVKIFIDKSGRISVQSDAVINLNNGSVDVADIDGLDVNNATLGTRGQHVAREHDEVDIPLTTSNDSAHLGLSSKASLNLTVLTTLAKAFVAPPGGGPCTLNSLILSGLKLQGEIVDGADKVYLGDSGT